MPSVIFSHTKKREQEYFTQLFEEKEWFKRERFAVFLPSIKVGSRQKVKGLSKKELATSADINLGGRPLPPFLPLLTAFQGHARL